MAVLLALWALTGGGISSTIMMIVWLRDPPSDFALRFFSTLVAGIAGGVVGGYLVHGRILTMDAQPEMIAAAGGGAILAGIVASLIPRRADPGH